MRLVAGDLKFQGPAADPWDMDRTALQSLAKRIDDLPLLPQVIARLMSLDSAADDYFDNVLALVHRDPPLAVRLIQLANSAASAPVTGIATLEAAMARMGADRVRALATALAVTRVFVPTEPGQRRLWSHSIETAVVSAEIARQCGNVDTETAYLAGLLHDIGRFVMLEHASEELRRVDAREWESPQQLVDSDLAVFRFTHCSLGKLACEHWGLPPAIGYVAEHHHAPADAAVAEHDKGHAALNACVQLADRISVAMLGRPERLALAPPEQAQLVVAECLDDNTPAAIAAPGLVESLPRLSGESAAMIAQLHG